MKRRKVFYKNNGHLSDGIKFCSECGEALEDFSLSELSEDKQALKENFKSCKKEGRFKGDICSKLFIINPAEFEPFEDEDD